ncbi:MAG: hypothetical protein AB8H03_18295 [Saprospiraceae bacterium]
MIINLPICSPPVSRGLNLSMFAQDQQVNPSICAEGSCKTTECCVSKFGIKKCLPNTFGYTGPVKYCGSISSQKGCCITPEGQKFCN